MTVTILVPDWDATQELRKARISQFSGRDQVPPNLRGYPIELDKSMGREVIVIKDRIKEIPDKLEDVRFMMFAMRHVSPLTTALSGQYNIPFRLEAVVEQTERNGMVVQSFSALGLELDYLYEQFGALMTGELNEHCVKPVPLAEQPLNLQVLDALNSARHVVQAALSADESVQTRENLIADMLQLGKVLGIRSETEPPAEVDLEKARQIVHSIRRHAGDHMDQLLLIMTAELWPALGMKPGVSA
jgi:hypothetical protein